MKQNNSDLKRYYRVANDLYFNGKLPKDMPIRFAKLSNHAAGVTHTWRNKLAVAVEIREELRTAQSFTIMTVLHEMLHVEKPSHLGHDWRFDRRMLRLAKMGAFDGLW